MKITKYCRVCDSEVSVYISRESYDAWKRGAHLQDVAPELTPDEREFLISGVCSNCFTNICREKE